MTNVISLPKSGYDGLTETDPNNFIFHSSYNTFKIVAEGTYSPTLADTGGAEVDAGLEHGLARWPFVFAFCKFENGRVGGVGNKASNANFWFTRLSVDGDSIQFYHINNTGGNYSPVFKYYITEQTVYA